jgi:hypothetical protein
MGNVSDSFAYQTVAAASTDAKLGASGAKGDYLSHINIQPTTTAASAIVKDGSTVLYTLTAGTLADLSPKTVPFNTRALTGFTVTTVNCTATAFGSFT